MKYTRLFGAAGAAGALACGLLAVGAGHPAAPSTTPQARVAAADGSAAADRAGTALAARPAGAMSTARGHLAGAPHGAPAAGPAGTGMAGTGMAGTGMAGTGMAGTGMAGTGMAGTGMAGTGTAGTQPGGSGAQAVANVRHLTLRAMPAGTVRFGRDRNGGLIARINMYGLTPGSTHTIEIQVAGRVNPVVPFVPLTADGMGRLHATAVSNWKGRSLPAGSRFVIRLGLHGGDGNINPVAAEPLARTIPLPRTLRDSVYRLSAVDFAPNGVSAGRLRGRATVSYNPLAHTLTVAVNAGGLTPGAHAAHIHSGTCMNQGGVLYMMADLVADKDGFIHQVRIISGVMTAPPATGWYLNIHQGDSNSILTANKTPSLAFRPLLCANI